MTQLTAEEFRAQLEKHDWHYAYSDDHQVYLRGEQERSRLIRIATDGPTEFRRIYNEIESRHYPLEQFSTFKPHFQFAPEPK